MSGPIRPDRWPVLRPRGELPKKARHPIGRQIQMDSAAGLFWLCLALTPRLAFCGSPSAVLNAELDALDEFLDSFISTTTGLMSSATATQKPGFFKKSGFFRFPAVPLCSAAGHCNSVQEHVGWRRLE